MKWDKLSMAERAKYIQLGVSNGITDLNAIRKAYNKYQDGGNLEINESNISTQNSKGSGDSVPPRSQLAKQAEEQLARYRAEVASREARREARLEQRRRVYGQKEQPKKKLLIGL